MNRLQAISYQPSAIKPMPRPLEPDLDNASGGKQLVMISEAVSLIWVGGLFNVEKEGGGHYGK
jgi:hypothetical protein